MFSAKYDDKPSVGEEDDVSNGMAEYWVQYTPELVTWLQSLDPELKGKKFSGPAQYVNFPGAKTSSYASFHLMYRITNLRVKRQKEKLFGVLWKKVL